MSQDSAAGLPAFLATLNLGELVIPLAILAIIVALITPMPALLLDVGIRLSVVVLMVSVYIPSCSVQEALVSDRLPVPRSVI